MSRDDCVLPDMDEAERERKRESADRDGYDQQAVRGHQNIGSEAFSDSPHSVAIHIQTMCLYWHIYYVIQHYKHLQAPAKSRVLPDTTFFISPKSHVRSAVYI